MTTVPIPTVCLYTASYCHNFCPHIRGHHRFLAVPIPMQLSNLGDAKTFGPKTRRMIYTVVNGGIKDIE